MRLKLSMWAEGLDRGTAGGLDGGCAGGSGQQQPNPYGVISALSSRPGTPPRELGRTETLKQTSNPDWTKFFVVEDFELGRPYPVSVSVYDTDDTSNDNDDSTSSNNNAGSARRRLLCSTMFELGHVLGSPGGVVGKQCSVGGGGTGGGDDGAGTILVLQVEPSHADLGVLRFQFGAGITVPASSVAPSEFYFEMQRLRQSVRTGSRVWDCVFRSRMASIRCGSSTLPRCGWDESFVELDEVCGGDLREPFRVALYESTESSSSAPRLRGECRCSIQDLTSQSLGVGGRAGASALATIGTDRALPLRGEGGADSGFLWVAVAEVSLDTSAPRPTEIPEAERRQRQLNDEGEIYVASPSEELVVDPYRSDASAEPTFVNFIRGGCQLHVVVAVDATASNGDPRKDGSLHCFAPSNGHPNSYERALDALCTLLSRYDSDQRYPVFGFGARPKGASTVSHCFPLHPDRAVVDGVPGIVQAYRDAFRSGIVMSSPRDYSAVVEMAAAQARNELQKGPQQAYSVLLIFSNGPPADLNKSIAAIRNAEGDPLSIVVVGIGDADFAPLQRSLASAASALRRDMVRFVPYRNESSSSYVLTSAALDPIPSQLEAYFASRGIRPNPPVAPDEIVVEPYRPEPSLVYQVPVAGTATAASPSSSYNASSVPVVAGSVYNPNVASSPSASVPFATVVPPALSCSYVASSGTIPVATGVPVHATSSAPSASPPPFNASLSTPLAAPTHQGSGTGASHSNNNNNNNSHPNNQNNSDDGMKGMGKKLLNRVGKHAVGRIKGQARAKINQFTRQKIGFGIL